MAALGVVASGAGVLALVLLGPRGDHGRPPGSPSTPSPSNGAVRSGWPIADAFTWLNRVSWLADDPNTRAVDGAGNGTSSPAPAPAPAPPPADGPPAETFVSQASIPPVAGEATGYGCTAALDYLAAYAAPGFWLVCPGDAGGHQAMTACESSTSPCNLLRIIVIADPCPAAYMNEASNSWALMGESDSPIDPYGSCA